VFTPAREASAREPAVAAPAATLLSLEVRALEIADRFADDDVLTVSRDARGGAVVSGLVTSPERRSEIVGALSALGAAVAVEIRTFDEAIAEHRTANASTRAEVRALPSGPAPLERWLAERLGPAASVTAAKLAPRMLEAVGVIRRNAVALAGVLDRVPLTAAASLDPPARQAWRAMVSRRAAAALAALATLDALLAPHFPNLDDRPASAPSDASALIERINHDVATIETTVSRAVNASAGTGAGEVPEALMSVRSRIRQTQRDFRRLHAGLVR
jgi:hypothetical protein